MQILKSHFLFYEDLNKMHWGFFIDIIDILDIKDIGKLTIENIINKDKKKN